MSMSPQQQQLATYGGVAAGGAGATYVGLRRAQSKFQASQRRIQGVADRMGDSKGLIPAKVDTPNGPRTQLVGVDPATLSAHRQMPTVTRPDGTRGRLQPPRYRAVARQERMGRALEAARHTNAQRFFRGQRNVLIGGTAATVAGLGAVAALGRRQPSLEGVGKDVDYSLSPQYAVGIPASRRNPISPLVMLASSTQMADFAAGALGRHLSRGEKKQLRQGAYQFAGAQQMLFTPLGYGSRMVG